MNKTIFLFVCVLMLAVLAGCAAAANPPDSSDGVWGSDAPDTTDKATPSPTAEATLAETVSPTETAGPTTASSTTPSPSTLAEGPSMYSSYAHMVTYDPAVGVADFDFFDMLRGKEAVDWLVEHEGHSQADAEAEVAQYADSEFIEKNTNKQLRTIDLKDIPITLMFDPDTGDMLDVSKPLKGTLIDLYSLYEVDPDLVLDSFFYWIEVQNGQVVSVEQVYWP